MLNSLHSASLHTPSRTGSAAQLEAPQYLQTKVLLLLLDFLLLLSSRNSIIPFKVAESAAAVSQNSFVLPQPSCRFTLIASSSSLKTCREWCLVFLCR